MKDEGMTAVLMRIVMGIIWLVALVVTCLVMVVLLPFILLFVRNWPQLFSSLGSKYRLRTSLMRNFF